MGMGTRMTPTNPARVFLETGVAWFGVMASKIEHFGPSDWAASVTVIYTVMQIIRMVTSWRAKKVAL